MTDPYALQDDALLTLVTSTGLDYSDARNALRMVREFVPVNDEEEE